MKKTTNTSPYQFEGRIPLSQAIPLGLQHVMAMFIGFDHCRIGSLEIAFSGTADLSLDHCRIGSLEIPGDSYKVKFN